MIQDRSQTAYEDRGDHAPVSGTLHSYHIHLSLGLRPFTSEIIVEPGSDPGVYTRSHELLRFYCRTHHHAVVVLDNDWRGSPGVDKIQTTIKENLTHNGWDSEAIEVVVIKPELEVWLWRDSPHIAAAFQFDHHPHPSLRKWLEAQGPIHFK